MEKEKVEGVILQFSAIFARLDALKQSLPVDSIKIYNELIEQKKRDWLRRFDVDESQVNEWLR